MTDCQTHANHTHAHGANCGHTAIQHGDHVDYLHDGHLHHAHAEHYDEHRLDVTDANPDGCHPVHTCGEHRHGAGLSGNGRRHGRLKLHIATKPCRTADLKPHLIG